MSATLLRQAESPEEIARARELFVEYEKAIGVDLCFQGFSAEVAGLPGAYAPPKGRLLLGWDGGDAAGCVALRPQEGDAAEMKRLYVRPRWRATGFGRRLALAVIDEARDAGYRRVRLDTLATMREAQALYVSLGFVDIPAYNVHPVEGTRFMELAL